MKKPFLLTLFTIILTGNLLFSCGTTEAVSEPQPVTTSLDSLFRVYLNHPALQGAQVGIFIQDPETRRVIFGKNPHTLFIPASNQKLITTAAALDILGPEHRFHTDFYAEDSLGETGVLEGDLYIRGGGDPTISGRFHEDDLTYDLRAWADSLKSDGITGIRGDIIVDANLFHDRPAHPAWENRDLSYWYAAQVSALSLNDNCVNITIRPGDSLGEPAGLGVEPETDYVAVDNRLVTVHEDSLTDYEYYREPGTNHIVFSGRISRSEDRIKDWVTVDDPARFTGEVFRDVLRKQGIAVTGTVLRTDSIPDYREKVRLFQHQSPPLQEILGVINQRSQNLYAEMVFKMLGFHKKADGSFAGGKAAVESYLAGVGVDTEHMRVSDGSGLSRHNLVSPFQLVTVLRDMYTGDYRREYLQSLSRAGENGTLENRFRGSIADGRVMAKTGYVGSVRTLSGYLDTMDNHRLIFSLMVNNYTTNTSVINELQDSLISIISSKTLGDLAKNQGA